MRRSTQDQVDSINLASKQELLASGETVQTQGAHRYPEPGLIRIKEAYGIALPAQSFARIFGYEAATGSYLASLPLMGRTPAVQTVITKGPIAAYGYGYAYYGGSCWLATGYSNWPNGLEQIKYNAWQEETIYQIDNKICDFGNVYKCLIPHVAVPGSRPPNGYWELIESYAFGELIGTLRANSYPAKMVFGGNFWVLGAKDNLLLVKPLEGDLVDWLYVTAPSATFKKNTFVKIDNQQIVSPYPSLFMAPYWRYDPIGLFGITAADIDNNNIYGFGYVYIGQYPAPVKINSAYAPYIVPGVRCGPVLGATGAELGLGGPYVCIKVVDDLGYVRPVS
jgi:hypothetical protein